MERICLLRGKPLVLDRVEGVYARPPGREPEGDLLDESPTSASNDLRLASADVGPVGDRDRFVAAGWKFVEQPAPSSAADIDVNSNVVFDQATQLFQVGPVNGVGGIGGIFVQPTHLGGASSSNNWSAGWTVGLTGTLTP